MTCSNVILVLFTGYFSDLLVASRSLPSLPCGRVPSRVLFAGLHRGVPGRPCMEYLRSGSKSLVYKVAAADVRVRVGRTVAVHVEQPVVQVPVVVATPVQARVGSVIVPVIGDEREPREV